MEWYLPFSLISGVGLLILSTSNLIAGLNAEILMLEKEAAETKKVIIERKIAQLKRLSIANVFQYVGLFLFTLTSILMAFIQNQNALMKGIILLGGGHDYCIPLVTHPVFF